jgi:hypothetical protein
LNKVTLFVQFRWFPVAKISSVTDAFPFLFFFFGGKMSSGWNLFSTGCARCQKKGVTWRARWTDFCIVIGCHPITVGRFFLQRVGVLENTTSLSEPTPLFFIYLFILWN